MNICIVMLTRNRSSFLQKCLRSLVPQLEAHDKVIIVDNGSFTAERRSNTIISRLYPIVSVRYLFLSHNIIPSGRNKGIDAILSDVDIIGFLDDDCIVAPQYISNLKRVHMRHDDWDVIQGRVKHLPKDNFYAQFTAEMYANWLESKKTESMMRTFDSKNVSLKVRVFRDKKNRFDEHLTYSSDIEFGLRLCRQGFLIRYEPSIVVYHKERDSFLPFIRQHIHIAAGEKDVGVGLFPARYTYHVQSLFRLAKRFILSGDIVSLTKLCIIVPLLLTIRIKQYWYRRRVFL